MVDVPPFTFRPPFYCVARQGVNVFGNWASEAIYLPKPAYSVLLKIVSGMIPNSRMTGFSTR